MSDQIAVKFQAEVVGHLEPFSNQLVAVLRRLVACPFVPEVHHLDFEVFCDARREGAWLLGSCVTSCK